LAQARTAVGHLLRRERYKWADKAMDGSVPSDIAREKQLQLADVKFRYPFDQ
jgi:hypothetical protein